MITASTARAAALVSAETSNNPFVAYENLGAAATLGGTTTLSGGPASNAVTGSTYDYWLPDVAGTTAELEFDFGSATSLTFASIAAHNAGTLGASIAVEHSTDAITWTDSGCGVIAATDDVMAFRFVATSKRYWRFAFTGLTASDALAVGVAFLGNELIIPRRLYQGFAPIMSPTEVQLQSNVSAGGNLLGSSTIARGSSLSATISHIPATFMRGDFLPFIPHFNNGGGFFFAWRPTKYVADVHYCWRDGGTIRPSNTGPLDMMVIEFNARAYNG